MTDPNLIQSNYLPEQGAADITTPISCLGMQFRNDDARRAYFTERLGEYLQDPANRIFEGFPIGGDEAILALSDPPYYTACPNPFLPKIIEEWQQQRGSLHNDLNIMDDEYHREPFTADVTEGKTDPIYNAHSYHTKVPHKAVMRYILHYTEPGDIVFDGFCGSGMSGVAAQLCGDKQAVEALGYRVDKEGHIYESDKLIGRLGVRRAVISDLSPAATFIAYNLNSLSNFGQSEAELTRAIDETESSCGDMYGVFGESRAGSHRLGNAIYTIWSDVFICPNCASEVTWWQPGTGPQKEQIVEPTCPNCGVKVPKREENRQFEYVYEPRLNSLCKRVKRVPVLINLMLPDGSRADITPSAYDLDWITNHGQVPAGLDYPMSTLTKGERYYKDGLHLINIERFDQFFMPRSLTALAAFRQNIVKRNLRLRGDFLITSVLHKTG